jgi:hypothetical protein
MGVGRRPSALPAAFQVGVAVFPAFKEGKAFVKRWRAAHAKAAK